MVVLTDMQKTKRRSENIQNNERDVVGFFLYKKSIQEGQKRDLQINDFIFEDTREAFNNMNQGYFYDHEKMSDNYQEMMLCRGPDSNIAKKINYLIGIS
jgi:hypothetical protein|tara:strand:+ start:413 stop:709 length:297 start_codon:yes stop_codon:yes gene_type:complete